MVQEAVLQQTEFGLVPKGEGWFVVNAKEARWLEHDAFGSGTVFEGDPRFTELGINIGVRDPRGWHSRAQGDRLSRFRGRRTARGECRGGNAGSGGGVCAVRRNGRRA